MNHSEYVPRSRDRCGVCSSVRAQCLSDGWRVWCANQRPVPQNEKEVNYWKRERSQPFKMEKWRGRRDNKVRNTGKQHGNSIAHAQRRCLMRRIFEESVEKTQVTSVEKRTKRSSDFWSNQGTGFQKRQVVPIVVCTWKLRVLITEVYGFRKAVLRKSIDENVTNRKINKCTSWAYESLQEALGKARRKEPRPLDAP